MTTTLGKVCDIYNGNSINANYKKTHFEGLAEGFPFIATKDVSFNGQVDYDNGVKIPFDTKYKKAHSGSVLICAEGGSAGRKIARIDQTVCFGNKLFCLVPKDNSLIQDFLYYYLLSESFQDQFKESIAGVIGGVSNSKIKAFNITFPSPDEQRKIVARLNATFERIDKMQSNAEQAYEEARKLLNSALESIFTPQDNWHKKEIQDIVDQGTSISYGIVQPGDDVQDGTPVIRPVDLGPEELSLSDSFKRTTNTISNGYKRTILNGKEILMCVRGTTGIVSLSNQTLIGCNVTRGIVPFKISSDTIRKYIYYWLQSPIAIDYIQKKTKGAALKQINIADVKKIPVYIPTNNQEIISITNKIQFITSRVIQLKHNMINMMDKHILLKQAILKETFE